MKVYTCFLLFRIFAYTNSLRRLRLKGDHRDVNLPQETVPEYSNEEYSGNTNNLNNEHNLRTRGKTLSNKNMELKFRAPRVVTLTDFIQEAVHILNTYEDTAFKDFFQILDNEIRKYHYRGCKFSELTRHSDTRSLLAVSLKLITGTSVSFTKANINEVADMIRDERYDKNVKELLDYINYLYRNTEQNFHTVLNELKYYRKTKSLKTYNDLVKFIRGGVRDIFFDHYSELNTNTRRELNERIKTFWKQFKNNPASSEINDIPYTDPVVKSVVNSMILKNPNPYSKNDPQMKLKNKSEKSVSIEIYNEQFQEDEPEINESINEFWKPDVDYANDESSSGQLFNNSSNSIKNSQERHEEYNTQRYMTLYTEEISYKANTKKKIKVLPLSANVMTKRPTVKKRRPTTSTPREGKVSSDKTEKIEMLRINTKQDISNSNHDTKNDLTLKPKHKPRTQQNYDKPRKHYQADESRSKRKHKNAQIITQYDAVIDVQLANTELLKSLGMFDPVGMDTNSSSDINLYPRSAIQNKPVPSKPTTRPRSMRARAEIKHQKPTALKKPSPRYLKSHETFNRKQFDESKRSIVPKEGHSVKEYKKDKNQKQKFIARRSNNDIFREKKINTYIIERIKALESELNELKQTNYFRTSMNDNNTDGVEVSNATDNYNANYKHRSNRKGMKGKIIERLLNQNHNLNNEELNKDNHNDRTKRTINKKITKNNTISSKSIVIKTGAVNATGTDNKITSQVTNNNEYVANNRKDINKGITNNNAKYNVTSVTNAMTFESVVTTPTVGITTTTMGSAEQSYYDYAVPPAGKSRGEIDPFDHNSDGIFLNT